jgi:pyridoxamine 5'-phosphate oxidase
MKDPEKTVENMIENTGETDPDYCVLRFTTQAGRVYSNLKSEDFTV